MAASSSEPANAPAKLPIWLKMVYASGQAGNLLNDSLLTTFMIALYMPNKEGAKPLIPPLIFGVLPVILTLSVLSRGWDSFWDPFVANWSDRATSKLGRRRIFMIVGCFPLALVSGLVFYPPLLEESGWNTIYLGVMLVAYYSLFSVYVGPYLALLPELAPDTKGKMSLSTFQAAGGLFGALLVMVVAPAVFFPASGEASRHDIVVMATVMAVVSFLLMLLPVLLIDENKRVHREPGGVQSTLGFFASIQATLKDKAFVPYVLGSTLFFFGFNIIRTAAPGYVNVLMKQPDSFMGVVLGATFGVAALAFPLVNWLSNKYTKRRVMMAGAALLGVMMALTPLINSAALGVAILGVSGISVSVLLSVPNAILADVCEASAKRTGEKREAMFFGAQGLFQKLNLGISTGLLAWLYDSFGHDVAHPLGVQLTGPMAAVALLGSVYCFYKYPERDVTGAT